MAADLGRNLLLKAGSTTIAAVRTKTLSIGNEIVDITTDDDSSYRSSLAEAGQKTLDISVDGIMKDNVLRGEAFTNTTTTSTIDTIEWPNGDSITGTFRIASYEESGTYNDAITFSASLQSSGQWTYTPV